MNLEVECEQYPMFISLSFRNNRSNKFDSRRNV